MAKHSEATFDRLTLIWIALSYLILLCFAKPYLISPNKDKRQSPEEEEKKRESKRKTETERERKREKDRERCCHLAVNIR